MGVLTIEASKENRSLEENHYLSKETELIEGAHHYGRTSKEPTVL